MTKTRLEEILRRDGDRPLVPLFGDWYVVVFGLVVTAGSFAISSGVLWFVGFALTAHQMWFLNTGELGAMLLSMVWSGSGFFLTFCSLRWFNALIMKQALSLSTSK